MEHRYLHKSGKTVWASWSASSANDANSEKLRLIFQIQDITDKRVAEEKLQHEATHDVLTGLPNRSYFMSRLTDALQKSRELVSFKVSILFIDLDRFKYVNDSLGHLAGDRLLKQISERLSECMRPTDLVARLGGDEFTILVEGAYDDREVMRIAERIQSKFNVPFDLNGNEVYSSASIGILHASDTHMTSEDMMRDADTAMYQAKKAGKARHEVFDENMFRAARETLKLETDLRRSIERNELNVMYQPIYSLVSGKIEGIEALARWDHSDIGPISPEKFIPIAEEIGMINSLFEFVLGKSCREIGEFHQAINGGVKPWLSVNLSCRQFATSNLVNDINRVLEENNFNANLLKFEITESVFVEHQENAVETLRKLTNTGIEIDIDDFGTGYSNLAYLTKLPIATLKIDRSFTAMIDDEGKNDEIVRAIVTLARNLGLKVVAEGIESASQLGILRSIGCESGQGYYFSRPLSLNDLISLYSRSDSIDLFKASFETIPEATLVQ
jgi:diguanylate cyclase (GGDEF)-like protein